MTNWPLGVDLSSSNWTGRTARTFFKGRYVMPRFPLWRVVIASLLAFNAQAAVVAQADNGGGGKIVLFDAVCKTNQNMRAMLGYSGDGEIMQGCWLAESGVVIIKWSDGDVRRYPIRVFKADSEGEKV